MPPTTILLQSLSNKCSFYKYLLFYRRKEQLEAVNINHEFE